MDISFDILGLNSAQAIFDQSELLLRIAIACVLGILIGNERKNRNKSAGVRTHAIVAMGSALMMVVSKYGFVDIMDYGKFDGARIAAQVVSGVGFLGAGIIFVRNNLVSGLTTSAGIWATARRRTGNGSGAVRNRDCFCADDYPDAGNYPQNRPFCRCGFRRDYLDDHCPGRRGCQKDGRLSGKTESGDCFNQDP